MIDQLTEFDPSMLAFAAACMRAWIDSALRKAAVAALIRARCEPTEASVRFVADHLRPDAGLAVAYDGAWTGTPVLTGPDGVDFAEHAFIRTHELSMLHPDLFEVVQATPRRF